MREQVFSWQASSPADLARRQRLLNLVLLGLAGPGLLFGLVMLVLWALGLMPAVGALAGLGVQPFYLLAYWLGRRGRARLAAYIPVLILFLVMSGAGYQLGVGHVTLVGYAMVTTTAGILIGSGAAFLFALLSMGAYVLIGLAQMAGRLPGVIPPESTVLADAVGLGLGLVVLVAFNWLSDREMKRLLQRERELSRELQARQIDLEQQVSDRTHDTEQRAAQMQAAAEVGRVVASILEPQMLAQQVVDLIHERFDLYYAALFLLDGTGQYAVLQAGSGEAGRTMKAQGHRLRVGGASLVGQACAQRQARLAQGAEGDPVHLNNPLLPDTRSELALPLILGDRLLGAVDVQSVRPAAFSEGDIAAWQLVAGQVAVGLENSRLFAQTQSSLEELRQVQRLMTGEAWQRLVPVSHYRLGESETPEETWQALFAQARERGEPVTSRLEDGGRYALALPIKYRGAPIGVLGLDRPHQVGDWQPQDIALGVKLAERLALALENARLLEQSQQQAARERAIRDISDRVTASFDLDTILRTTVEEIGRFVGASGGYVELGVTEAWRRSEPEADAAPEERG